MTIRRYPSYIQVDFGSTKRRANVDGKVIVTIQESDCNISRPETAHLPAFLHEESERNEDHEEDHKNLFSWFSHHVDGLAQTDE